MISSSNWNHDGLCYAKLNGANPKVLAHFVFFHDCQRQDEGADKYCGERAADFVKTIRGDFELTGSEFSLLERAIRLHHRRIYEDQDITVMSCWDADRLNFLRVGRNRTLVSYAHRTGEMPGSSPGQTSELKICGEKKKIRITVDGRLAMPS